MCLHTTICRAGEILSVARTRALLAGTKVGAINGGAAWYDGVCTNTERLLWEVIDAARTAGAQAFNYVEADELLLEGGRVSGVRATDRVGGASLTVRATVVVNAAGPWVDEWLPSRSGAEPMFHASYGFNLLTRPFPSQDAIGFAVPRRARDKDAFLDKGTNTYFILPWNGLALIGTRHLRCPHGNRNPRVAADEVAAFLEELNPMLGEHRLRGDDVRGVFSGLLPEVHDAHGSEVVLDKTARVRDHGEEEGVQGLLSVVGVKWTTSRLMGERAARKAAAMLNKQTDIASPRSLPSQRAEWMQFILHMDTALSRPVVDDLAITGAQIIYAARHERAIHLSDAIMRRQPLYLSCRLDRAAVHRTAQWMAPERNWSAAEVDAQVSVALQDLLTFQGRRADLP